jgi:hypothetical protein
VKHNEGSPNKTSSNDAHLNPKVMEGSAIFPFSPASSSSSKRKFLGTATHTRACQSPHKTQLTQENVRDARGRDTHSLTFFELRLAPVLMLFRRHNHRNDHNQRQQPNQQPTSQQTTGPTRQSHRGTDNDFRLHCPPRCICPVHNPRLPTPSLCFDFETTSL